MTSPGGGDYNLGRAHGEIEITADTRGAQEAQAAMAATRAEADLLDRQMGRVNETFQRNKAESVSSAEAIQRQRQQAEDLRRTYQRYYEDLERAKVRAEAATRRLDQATKNEATDAKELDRLRREAERARDNEERLVARVTDAHARYEQRLASVRAEVARFNEAHIAASSGLNRMRVEADRAGEAIESLSSKLSSVLRIVGQGGIMGLFGLGSAGTMAATGAAGLSGLTNVMAGVIEMVQQLSGVVALLPAAVGGAAVALGTLATAFQGIGAAISAVGDPTKFIEAIRNLAPAARQAMLVFYSFQDAIRGVRFAIQEATFEPFVRQLQPLIVTWLPLLQNAGVQVGRAFGQMASQVLSFFQTAGAQQGFNTFIQNMVVGLQAASRAIQPLMSAFQTLAVVGSGFFQRIGDAITTVANEFNNWVQGAANSGRLQAWINQALTGFTNLAHVALNLTEAISNIFAIGDRYGGGFIGFIRELSQEFVNWTRSADGMATIASFFDLLRSAGAAIHPILRLLAQGFDTIFQTLTRLGINIAPAVTQFFQSIVDSLRVLAPFILQSGPAISSFLVAFGQAILQVVQGAGPELPRLILGLSEAFTTLLPVLLRILPSIVAILNRFTPAEIQGIFLAAVAIRTLSGAFSLFTGLLSANPIVIVIGALALLGAAAYEAYQHWQPFHDAVQTVWNALQEFANWLGNLPGIISTALQPVDAFVAKATEWGSHFVENFAHGIMSGIHWVTDAIGTMMDAARGHLPGSRAKYGPFAQQSPEELGAATAQGYAAGLSSGTDAVGSASSGLAGSAAGTTGLGFSTAGAGGRSGVGVQGNSGFDRYVKFLTTDLQAWNNILSQGFQLVQKTITGVIVPTIKTVADLWNGGDNPLTRPGGIAGPQVPWGQQQVPGITNVPMPGVAPDQWGRDLAARGATPGQQVVPGVQNVAPQNRPRPIGPGLPGAPGGPPAGPGSAGGAPTGAPPTQTGAAPPVGGPQPAPPSGRSQQDLTNYIMGSAMARGFTREQAAQFVAQAYGESNIGTNNYGATTGDVSGAARGVFQFTPGTAQGIGLQDPNDPIQNIDAYFRLYQSRAGAPPGPGVDIRSQLARTSAGGPAVQGNIGLTWEQAQAGAAPFVAGFTPPAGQPSGLDRFAAELQRRRDALNQPAGAPGGPVPGAAVNPATRANFPLRGTTTEAFRASGDPNPPLYTPGSDTGGYGGPGQNVLPDWVKQFADKFGLVASTYPEGGTLHQAGYAFDFVPKPGNPDPVGSMDAFATFIQQNLSPQTLELIHFNERTGQKWGIAGAKDVTGTPYYADDYGGHGDYGQGAHVHWATDVPPVLPGINAPLPAPGATAPGAGGAGIGGPGSGIGSQIPGATGGYGLRTGLIAGAGAAVVGGTGLLASRAVGRYNRTIADVEIQQGINALIEEGDFEGAWLAMNGIPPGPRPTGGGGVGSGPGGAGGTPATGVGADATGGRVFVAGSPIRGRAIGPAPVRAALPPGTDALTGDFQVLNERVLGRVPTGGPGLRTGLGARGLLGAADAAAIPLMINQAGEVADQQRGRGWLGPATGVAGPVIIGGGVAAAGAAAGVLGPAIIGAGVLGAVSTATGAATGQESTQTPGVIYGPNGQVISAGPRRTGTQGTPPANPPAQTQGQAPAQTQPTLRPGEVQIAPGVVAGGGPGTAYTRRQDAPGGPSGLDRLAAGVAQGRQRLGVDVETGTKPVPVNITHQGGEPVQTPTQQRQVALRDQQTPIAPQPGQPGFVGPVRPRPAQVQGQPAPSAQNVPGATEATGQPGQQGQFDYRNVYAPDNMPGKLPFNAKSPLEAFTSTMSSVGSIAGDAFQIFTDVIQNIQATADIASTLARGPENTEDIVKMIKDFQTYIKTAADVAKLVGDIGGMAGGASGGMDMGAGGALQAIAGIVQSALEGINDAITIGIDVYHEVGKYAGYIFGEFLGGPNTGPLGGNVRMLLNTRTNQLYTYSEDNPLNKNTLNIPTWQQSYQQNPGPLTNQTQINYYAGPGDSPQQFMSNSMYMATTGSAPVASVSGRD